MHDNRGIPNSFDHGPRWLRRWLPRAILYSTVIAVLLVISGVAWDCFERGNMGEAFHCESENPVCRGIYQFSNFAYNVGRALIFDAEPGRELHGNPIIAIGVILVALTAGLMGFALWFRMIDHLRVRWAKHHVVVCGLDTIVGQQIVKNALKEKRRVIAIDQDTNSIDRRHKLDELRKSGAIVLECDQAEEDVLRDVLAGRASAVYATDEVDVINVEVAVAMQRINPNVPCYVHLNQLSQADSLGKALMRSCEGGTIGIFSQYKVTTTHLLETLFKDQCPGPDKAFQAILVGFGEMGQTIALELAGHAHFNNGMRPEIIICDENLDSARRHFIGRFPRFCPEGCNLSAGSWDSTMDKWDFFRPDIRPEAPFRGAGEGNGPGIEYAASAEFLDMPCGPDSEQFISDLRKRMRADAHSVVIVCTDDERRNADIALRLSLALKGQSTSIYTWIPQTEALVTILNKTNSSATASDARLIPFGMAADVLTSENITHSPLEALSEAIHKRHCELAEEQKKSDPKKEIPLAWKQLEETYRKSCRERAQSLYLKVYALGLGYAKEAEAPEETKRINSFNKEQISALERMEHARWLADRLLDGWSYNSVRQNELKHHPLLIPFDQLPAQEKRKDETVAEEIMDTFRERKVVIFAKPAM